VLDEQSFAYGRVRIAALYSEKLWEIITLSVAALFFFVP
jgi:hypothetical protein